MSTLLLFALLAAQAAAEPPLALKESDAAVSWVPCPSLFPSGCQIAVLHGDPARPNADLFLKVPAGYEIPAHHHSSAERMILVNGRMEVEYQGSRPAMLEAGSYAYGPAHRPHRAKCVGEAHCTLFIAFEGPVDAVAHEGKVN